MASSSSIPKLFALFLLIHTGLPHLVGDTLPQATKARRVIAGVLTSSVGKVVLPSCEKRVELATMLNSCLQSDQGLCVSRIGSASFDQNDPVACCCPFKLLDEVPEESAVLDAPQGMCACGGKAVEKYSADNATVAAFNAGWTFGVDTEWIVKDEGGNHGSDDFEIYNSLDELVMKGHASRGLLNMHDRWELLDARGEFLMTIIERGKSAVYKHYEIVNLQGQVIATIRLSVSAPRTELYMYSGDPVFNWRNRPVDEETRVLMTIASTSAVSNRNVEVFEGDYEANMVNASDEHPAWKWNTNLGGYNEYKVQVAAGKPVKLVIAGMIIYDEVVEDLHVCVTLHR